MDLRSIQYIDSNGDVMYAEPGQEIVCTPGSSSSATLMQTGQYVSYTNGDDAGFRFIAGRELDFFNLLDFNPFGETFRFSDEFGGYFFNNGIVIDWSTYNKTNNTVLGWHRNPQGSVDWTTAITSALSASYGGFSGWRVGNVAEYFSICNFGQSSSLSYYPMNISTMAYFHTSTTYTSGTTNAIKLYYTGQFIADPKANNAMYLCCRTFTVNGTTLT